MGRLAPSGRWASGLTLAAFAWAVGVFVAGILVPVYGTSQSVSSGPVEAGRSGGGGIGQITTSSGGSTTLVGVNGVWALVAVAVPAVVAGLVWVALGRGSRGGDLASRLLVGLFVVFCLAAVMSIGMFVAPVALLLAAAVALAPEHTAVDGGGRV